MRTTILAALAAFSLGVTGPPAEARTASTTVQFGDLDLSDPADLAKLESRINYAVRRLCDPPSLGSAQDREHCRVTAHRWATEQLARVLDDEQRRVLAALTVRTND